MLLIILFFEFCWWNVSDWLEQSPVVEPVDPSQRGELHVFEMPPRTSFADDAPSKQV
jgi:hypothetical protein